MLASVTTCWLSKSSCSELGTQTGPDASPETSFTRPSSCLVHTALILTSRLPATSPQQRGRAWLGSAQHLLQGLYPRNHGLGHSHPGRKQPREEFPDDICQPCPAGRVLLIQGSQGCVGPTKRALPSLPPAARGKAGLWRPRGIPPASHRPGLSWPNALVPLGAAHLSGGTPRSVSGLALLGLALLGLLLPQERSCKTSGITQMWFKPLHHVLPV